MSQDIAALERELNEMIASGQATEAFEKSYADDVVMVAARRWKDGKVVSEQFFYEPNITTA